jgi:hypothetical protein
MIDYPDLEIRNEDQLAAAAIARISGGLTVGIVDAQIAARRELRALVEAGLGDPICPELTNANPSSPHTVIIEAIAWTLAQQAHRINRVPEQNLIAFANLFGIVQRPATAALTTLRFAVDPPPLTDVTIAAGTQITSDDGRYVFETAEDLVIPYGTATGDVAGVRSVTGHTLLSPGVLTDLVDNPAFVTAVTNPAAIDSGSELEALAQTLERVKRYARRGERIVSTKDLEEAIADEALAGNGVVRAFPFVRNGEFDLVKRVGHTTVVVMTKSGETVDASTRARINALTDTAVGNQFIYVVDPAFVEFDVEASVQVNTGSPEGAVLAAAEANLRAFYAASRVQFGRPILRSEIIAVIEGTAGIDRIVAGETAIITSPTADTRLKEYELPKLIDVTLNVV